MEANVDKYSYVYRGRRYWLNGDWRTWYEQCPIVKQSELYATARSQSFPGTPLYPGGDFRLALHELKLNGKKYHSRHGEYFYLQPQDDSFLFPSKDVLEMKDFATIEADQIGWSESKLGWHEWQKQCWLYAILLKMPLRSVIDRWKTGGESVFFDMQRLMLLEQGFEQ